MPVDNSDINSAYILKEFKNEINLEKLFLGEDLNYQIRNAIKQRLNYIKKYIYITLINSYMVYLKIKLRLIPNHYNFFNHFY